MYRVEIRFGEEKGYGTEWMLFENCETENEADWLMSALKKGWANKHLSGVRVVKS